MKYLLVIVSIFSFCNVVRAQNDPSQVDPYKLDWSNSEPLEPVQQLQSSDDDASDDYPVNSRGFVNTGFVLFPIYSRADGQSALGLDLMYYFRRKGDAPLSEPSYIRTFFAAGKNQYATLGASFNNYWDNEQNNLFTSFYYNRKLSGFFEPFTYTPALLGAYQASDFDAQIFFRSKVTSFSYIGAKYEFAYNMMDNKVPSSAFSNRNDLVGLNGGPESGFGIFWNNTPTENIFSPKTSFLFDLEGMFYSTWFGGKFDFGKYTLDLKEYYKFYGQHTIVVEYYAELHSGDVPYRQLASVGNIFNAYSVDKYTGRHLMAIKGEYRLPLFSRMFLTAFIGTAYLTDSFSKFKLNSDLPSYGGGARFLVNSDLNINARLDFVSGRDGNGVWFGIGEGF